MKKIEKIPDEIPNKLINKILSLIGINFLYIFVDDEHECMALVSSIGTKCVDYVYISNLSLPHNDLSIHAVNFERSEKFRMDRKEFLERYYYLHTIFQDRRKNVNCN